MVCTINHWKLIIGFIASDQQALGIKPFTTDMFKGF
jgi:hypothetical protein